MRAGRWCRNMCEEIRRRSLTLLPKACMKVLTDVYVSSFMTAVEARVFCSIHTHALEMYQDFGV